MNRLSQVINFGGLKFHAFVTDAANGEIGRRRSHLRAFHKKFVVLNLSRSVNRKIREKFLAPVTTQADGHRNRPTAITVGKEEEGIDIHHRGAAVTEVCFRQLRGQCVEEVFKFSNDFGSLSGILGQHSMDAR